MHASNATRANATYTNKRGKLECWGEVRGFEGEASPPPLDRALFLVKGLALLTALRQKQDKKKKMNWW